MSGKELPPGATGTHKSPLGHGYEYHRVRPIEKPSWFTKGRVFAIAGAVGIGTTLCYFTLLATNYIPK